MIQTYISKQVIYSYSKYRIHGGSREKQLKHISYIVLLKF